MEYHTNTNIQNQQNAPASTPAKSTKLCLTFSTDKLWLGTMWAGYHRAHRKEILFQQLQLWKFIEEIKWYPGSVHSTVFNWQQQLDLVSTFPVLHNRNSFLSHVYVLYMSFTLTDSGLNVSIQANQDSWEWHIAN